MRLFLLAFAFLLILPSFGEDDFEYDYRSVLQSIADDVDLLGRIDSTLDSVNNASSGINQGVLNFRTEFQIFQNTLLPYIDTIKQNTVPMFRVQDEVISINSRLLELGRIKNVLSSIDTHLNSLSIPNYSSTLSSILNSLGGVNTTLDSIESDLSGLALDSTVSSGIQAIRDDFADFRNSNIADLITYTGNTSSWLGDYIYPDVHQILLHLGRMKNSLSSINDRINIPNYSSVLSSIDQTLGVIRDFSDSISTMQIYWYPSFGNHLDTIDGTVSEILTKLNEISSSSDSSYDDDEWKNFRAKTISFQNRFNKVLPSESWTGSFVVSQLAYLNWANTNSNHFSYQPQGGTQYYPFYVCANQQLNYIRELLATLSFSQGAIYNRMPSQKDTSEEQSQLESSVSSTADGRDSIVDSFDFSGLEYNPKNNGVDSYFDYSELWDTFEPDLPGTITFPLPEFSIYGHSFGGQSVNISTDDIRPLIDTMRACFAVIYWTVVGAIVLFGFKIFLKLVRHFVALVRVSLQW